MSALGRKRTFNALSKSSAGATFGRSRKQPVMTSQGVVSYASSGVKGPRPAIGDSRVPEVQVYERAAPSFAATLAKRGHHVVYRNNALNHCPGCGRSHWIIGRITAECGFCETAIPLAEARGDYQNRPNNLVQRNSSPDHRRSPRTPAHGRNLELLIGGAPMNFALHNISEGGAMGKGAVELAPGTMVCVRSENGSIVPAVVIWAEDGLLGLAFTATN